MEHCEWQELADRLQKRRSGEAADGTENGSYIDEVGQWAREDQKILDARVHGALGSITRVWRKSEYGGYMDFVTDGRGPPRARMEH